MTTFYLVRHGTNDYLPHTLAGRMPGVCLNAEGRAEAEQVALRLKGRPITQIFSSPLERTMQTAQPLAQALGLKIVASEALLEVEFGEWKGAAMTSLANDFRWKQWNTFRTGHILPDGETMIAIQARMAGEMIRLKNSYPNQHLALFSHGDPIRAALCYWLGMPLDFLQRLQADTGSVSIVSVDDHSATVQAINLK